jgi:hypothetical protein
MRWWPRSSWPFRKSLSSGAWRFRTRLRWFRGHGSVALAAAFVAELAAAVAELRRRSHCRGICFARGRVGFGRVALARSRKRYRQEWRPAMHSRPRYFWPWSRCLRNWRGLSADALVPMQRQPCAGGRIRFRCSGIGTGVAAAVAGRGGVGFRGRGVAALRRKQGRIARRPPSGLTRVHVPCAEISYEAASFRGLGIARVDGA